MVSACYGMCVSIQTGCLIFSKMCDSISVEVELTDRRMIHLELLSESESLTSLKVPELKRCMVSMSIARCIAE